MALRCFSFSSDEPFQKRHIFLDAGAEGIGGISHDADELRDMTYDLERQKEVAKAKEKLDESNLLPENAAKLMERIEELPKDRVKVVLETLDDAIEKLDMIEGLADTLGPERYEAALNTFDKAYEDFDFSAEEIRKIALIRREADEILALHEAHKSVEWNNLTIYALSFVEGNEGMRMQHAPGLDEGTEYTVNITNPETGRVNETANSRLRLAHIMQAADLDHVQVFKNGEWIDAYLWENPDDPTRSGALTRQPGTGTYDWSSNAPGYVSIYNGTKFRVPASAPEETKEVPAAPSDEELIGELDELMSNNEARQVAALEKVEADAVAGAHPHLEITEDISARSTDRWGEVLGEHEWKAVLSEDFAGKDSWEHIEMIRYMENGEQIWAALTTMVEIRQKLGRPVDHRRMWEELRKGMVRDGEGKFTITFDEMAKAVFGINTFIVFGRDPSEELLDLHAGGEENFKRIRNRLDTVNAKLAKNPKRDAKRERLEEEKAALENYITLLEDPEILTMFFAAAEQMMVNAPEAKDTGQNAETYRERREAGYEEFRGDGIDTSDMSPEEAEHMNDVETMVATTDQFFEAGNYGPYVQFGVFKHIQYKFIKKKERPRVTMDNWMDSEARWYRGDKEDRYTDYGETEIISHARAYDKLMESGDLDAYAANLTHYMSAGYANMHAMHAVTLHGNDQIRQEKPGEAVIVTADMLREGWTPTEEQVEAVRHGAMIEAAKELHIVQEATTAVSEGSEGLGESNPVATELAERAAKEEELTDEQQEELERATSKGLAGVAKILAEDHNLEDGITVDEVRAAFGVVKDLPHGFELDFVVSRGWSTNGEENENFTVEPVLWKASTGVTYTTRRFGKRQKWEARAYARMDASFGDGGYTGPRAGGEVKRYFGENEIWAAKAGANVTLESLSVTLGAERDLNAVLDKRVDKVIEKNREAIDAALADYEAYLDDEIEAGRLNPADKVAYMAAFEEYIHMQIRSGKIDDFTEWYKQVRFVGAGVGAAVGLKEGGFGGLVYMDFAIGLRKKRVFTPAPTRHYERVESADGTPGVVLAAHPGDVLDVADTDVVMVEIDDTLFLEGVESKEEAIALVRERDERAIAKLNENSEVKYTYEDEFVGMEFPEMTGNVKLYMDPNAPVDLLRDGPTDFGMALDIGMVPIVHIRETADAFGGEKTVEIVVTFDPAASMESVMNASPDYLTWQQDFAGRRSETVVMDNSNPENEGTESAFLDASALDRPGSISRMGAEERAIAIKYSDILGKNERREWGPFERVNGFGHLIAVENAAENLVNDMGKEAYRKLATGDADDIEAINNALRGYLSVEGVTEITEDHLLLARQFAMEKSTKAGNANPDWNKEVMTDIAAGNPDAERAAAMLREYMDINYANRITGKPNADSNVDGFDEGSEFMLFIHQDGTKLMEGVYDYDVHGDIVEPLQWNTEFLDESGDPIEGMPTPEETLKALGQDVTPENIAAVKAYREELASMDWPPIKIESFDDTLNSNIGGVLMTQIDEFYPADQADQLRQMWNERSDALNPELAAEFTQHVKNLAETNLTNINGTPVNMAWEYRTGIYDKCNNPVIGRNPVLYFMPPGAEVIGAGDSHDKVEEGMVAQESVSYKVVRVDPFLIPKVADGGTLNADQDGNGTQNTHENITDPSDEVTGNEVEDEPVKDSPR